MKKIFFLILTLVLYLSSFAQINNDSTKYVWYRYTYGNRLSRYWADSLLDVPHDTLRSKTGWSKLSNWPAWGNDTAWAIMPKLILTSPHLSDIIGLGDTLGRTLINIPGAPGSGTKFIGIPTIIDNGNLNYTVNTNGGYFINNVLYPTSSGTFNLPVGTAGVDSGRIDEIVATAAGVGSIQGDNSDNPVQKDVNELTTLEIGTVTILTNSTTAANASVNVLVFDENVGSTVEFNTSVTGATANFNSLTNPFHSTKTISITAFTAGQFITFTHVGALNKSDYTNINGYIRLNNVWNAATTYSIQLLNGATVSNSVALTSWGVDKNITGSYQPFSIPVSLFSNFPLFTAIRITRTGAGGTTNWLLDYIQLQQSGITISTGTTVSPGGNEGNVQIKRNNLFDSPQLDTLSFNNGVLKNKGKSVFGPYTGSSSSTVTVGSSVGASSIFNAGPANYNFPTNVFHNIIGVDSNVTNTGTMKDVAGNFRRITFIGATGLRTTFKFGIDNSWDIGLYDSTNFDPQNQDGFAAVSNSLNFGKWSAYTGRSVAMSGTGVGDAMAATLSTLGIYSTAVGNRTYIRNGAAGYISYIISETGSTLDTLENWYGFTSGGAGNLTPTVLKWRDYTGGGLGGSTHAVKAWFLYQFDNPTTVVKNKLAGPTLIDARGTGQEEPVASAILEVPSTTQGILPPRMTTTQKNAISSPAEGLIVYDLTLHKLYVYDGSTWQAAW